MEGLVCIALFVGMLALIWWGLVWAVDTPTYDEISKKPKYKEVRPFDVCLALIAGLDKLHIEELGIFSKDFNWAFRVKSGDKFVAVHFSRGNVVVKIFGDSPDGRIMHTTSLNQLRAPVELEAFVRYFVGVINAAATSKDKGVANPLGWY